MRSGAVAVLLCAALVAAGCGSGGESGPPKLTFYTFTAGSGGAFEEGVKRCTDQARGRWSIKIADLPPNAVDQRIQLARRLAAEDSDIDVMALDVIFTSEFAKAGWIREWTGRDKAVGSGGAIPSTLRTGEFEGKLYAAPYTSNTQLLWYRKDRVKQPPQTWDQMIREAERIGPDGKIQVQGKQAEGLVVWFTTLLHSAGGKVLASPTKAALGPPAVRAAEVMKEVATSSAADPSLPNQAEDEGRLAFETGGSTFMVNYPFVYASAKENAPDVYKNMAAARYPRVNPNMPSRPPLGGLNLAVSQYSEHPREAFEAAVCLRDPQNQLTATKLGGLPPTQSSLYEDDVVKEAYPGFAPLMKESIAGAEPRPATPAYNDVSLAIQKGVHPPSEIDPQKSIEDLEKTIDDVLESGGVL